MGPERPTGGSGDGPVASTGTASPQEQLIAAHEAVHGPLPRRILAELRAGAEQAESGQVTATGGTVTRAAADATEASQALRLHVVRTGFSGSRALVGHALGLRLLIPAEKDHGPREAASLLYLFRDAIAIRPTDDAPMSAVPLYGLHIVMPHVAMAHWAYKAARTAHADLDLEKDDRAVEAFLEAWTVDDFVSADPKVVSVKTEDIQGPVHLYRSLELVNLAFTPAAGRPVHLRTALPEEQSAFQALWDVCSEVLPGPRLFSIPPSPG